MSFSVQIAVQIGVVAAGTLVLFAAPSWLFARAGFAAPRVRDVSAHVVAIALAAMGLRLLLVAAFALALGLRRGEHAAAHVATVGATYVLAALVDGVRRFKRRGSVACPTP